MSEDERCGIVMRGYIDHFARMDGTAVDLPTKELFERKHLELGIEENTGEHLTRPSGELQHQKSPW